MYTVDFETHRIVSGSNTAPTPVGAAVKTDDNPAHYYAWGHPTNNNCHIDEGADKLQRIWHSNELIIMHNAKFDCRVAWEHFGLRPPEPSRLNDTMIMAYLNDPRDESLKLKDLAHKYCGMTPDEQTDLKNWILKHVKEASAKTWGEYIYRSPGDLVGRYACADVDMTYALYNLFKGVIYETI